jgi:putative component of membrane protein insertase Oxa1/YidC/SpoIIIJ protein YidD
MNPLSLLSIYIIRLYQLTLSPDCGILSPWLRGRVCVHEPHCSKYAIESLRRYSYRTARNRIVSRVLSCRPSYTMSYHPSVYRVVFFSSAPIGQEFLRALIDDPRYDVI